MMPLLRLAAVAALALVAARAAGQATESFDRFTGAVTVATAGRPMVHLQSEPVVSFYASYERVNLSGWPVDPRLSIHLSFTAPSWRYLKCPSAHWLADGRRVELPAPAHEGDVGAGYVWETLIIRQAPLPALRQLAAAEMIEVKVCADQFELTRGERDELRELLGKLGPEG